MLLKQSDRFTILDGDTDYSDKPKGMVISQYPEAYVDVALDEEIRLVISAGPEMLRVPDYHVWNYTEARIEAENAATYAEAEKMFNAGDYDGAIAAFEAIARPMDDMIRSNYEENCRLQELRDSLLPRLMSGEVDVSDIDI